MMTLHRLSGETGYAYYVRETVSGDELRAQGSELGDYYAAKGYPPGQWIGGGLAQLGVSGTVTEAQMRNLYRDALHPDAERIREELIAGGKTAKQAERAVQLGRRPYKYDAKDSELGQKIAAKEAEFVRRNGRQPNSAELHGIRGQQGAMHFREVHGRAPVSKEELNTFITARLRPQQASVSGYDTTFTPVKSVSVAWALGGKEVRDLIEKAQWEAVNESIAWMEKHGIATRLGANGIAQTDVAGGVIASAFRHHDSRKGDPNLHHHVVIANRVSVGNGQWKTIDSRLLHKIAVAASEHYNTALQRNLEHRGYTFTARSTGASSQPVFELADVPAALNKEFSQRRSEIVDNLDTAVADFTEKSGRAPTQTELVKLAQTANLDTREDKTTVRSAQDMAPEWERRAAAAVGSQRALEKIIAKLQNPTPDAQPVEVLDVNVGAAAIIERVEEKYSTWARQTILAEANRWAREQSATYGPLTQEGIDALVAAAIDTHSVKLTPEGRHVAFKPLQRADGTSVFAHRQDDRYTSTRVIANENMLLAAAEAEVIPPASVQTFAAVHARVNAEFIAKFGDGLSADKEAFARQLATSPALLSVGIGPAGTGKTTAMKVVAETIAASGGKVVALAPSAAAAKVLSADIGVKASTTDAFLTIHAGGYQHRPKHAHLALNPGDVIVVDEAGMQGTANLAAVVRLAKENGAVVRLVGDDHQIGAVSSGGMFSSLAQHRNTVTLDEIHRFKNPEEATASLKLRAPVQGEIDRPFDWYKDNDRVFSGTQQDMEAWAFSQWQTAVNEGKDALMIANTNEAVLRLNEVAQAYRLNTGEVKRHGATVKLPDGTTVHYGETIVTRKNDTQHLYRRGREFVKNGDNWTVMDVRKDGSLYVEHVGNGARTVLTAEYVDQHVQLGYAVTANRSQGATVRVAAAIADSSTTRQNAYVPLTRGKEGNYLGVVVGDEETLDSVLDSIAARHSLEESAHTAINSEISRVDALPRAFAEYGYVDERAHEQRFAQMAEDALGTSASGFLNLESWGAVSRRLLQAEQAGLNPRRVLLEAHNSRGFSDAEDNSAVLAWRIDRIQIDAEKPEATPRGERPLGSLSGVQLNELERTASDREARAREWFEKARNAPARAPLAHVGRETPLEERHWTQRPYGGLTDTELDQRIADLRFYKNNAAAINDPALERKNAWELKNLRAERLVRDDMLEPRARTLEFAERGTRSRHGSAKIEASGHRDRYYQSRTIAAAIRAEKKARTRDINPEIAADHGPLPAWLAPSRAINDPYLPEAWREHLQTRLDDLVTRFEERGYLLAANPPTWAQKLGPVPEREDLAQRWRATAAEVEQWRERHNIGAEISDAIPRQLRADNDVAAELHKRVVSVSRSSHAVHHKATEADIVMDAINAVHGSDRAHTTPTPAQLHSDSQRAFEGLQAAPTDQRTQLDELHQRAAAAAATEPQPLQDVPSQEHPGGSHGGAPSPVPGRDVEDGGNGGLKTLARPETKLEQLEQELARALSTSAREGLRSTPAGRIQARAMVKDLVEKIETERASSTQPETPRQEPVHAAERTAPAQAVSSSAPTKVPASKDVREMPVVDVQQSVPVKPVAPTSWEDPRVQKMLSTSTPVDVQRQAETNNAPGRSAVTQNQLAAAQRQIQHDQERARQQAEAQKRVAEQTATSTRQAIQRQQAQAQQNLKQLVAAYEAESRRAAEQQRQTEQVAARQRAAEQAASVQRQAQERALNERAAAERKRAHDRALGQELGE